MIRDNERLIYLRDAVSKVCDKEMWLTLFIIDGVCFLEVIAFLMKSWLAILGFIPMFAIVLAGVTHKWDYAYNFMINYMGIAEVDFDSEFLERADKGTFLRSNIVKYQHLLMSKCW